MVEKKKKDEELEAMATASAMYEREAKVAGYKGYGRTKEIKTTGRTKEIKTTWSKLKEKWGGGGAASTPKPISNTKPCYYCRTPIPKDAKVCSICNREQPSTGKRLKWPIILGGTVILIFFIYFTFSDFINLILGTALPIRQVTEIKNTLSGYGCIAQCYVFRIKDVSTWQTYGDIGKYCEEVECGRMSRVKELGCTECYSIEVKALRPYIPPLSTETVKITVDMKEGKDYTLGGVTTKVPNAKDVKVSVIADGTPTELVGRCADGCDISPESVPFSLNAKFDVPCKRTVSYDTYLTYSFEAAGNLPIVIVSERYSNVVKEPEEPIATPGPLKLKIDSVTPIYDTSQDKKVTVLITLVNKGSGIVKITSLKLNQIYPKDSGVLGHPTCMGATVEVVPKEEESMLSLKFEGIPLIEPGDYRGYAIDCDFDMSEVNIDTQKTYIFTGVAEYEYTLSKKDEKIFIDDRYSCELTTSNWFMLQCKDENCVNNLKTTEPKWFNLSFDDITWSKVSLPDKNWGCDNCDRFYRKKIIWDGKSDVWLNVSSDDGAECYVSNNEIFKVIDDLEKDGEWVTHEMGENWKNAKTKEELKSFCCGKFIDEANILEIIGRNAQCSGTTIWDLLHSELPECNNLLCNRWCGWDYSVLIGDSSDLENSKLKEKEENVIACRVHNVEKYSGFDVSE